MTATCLTRRMHEKGYCSSVRGCRMTERMEQAIDRSHCFQILSKRPNIYLSLMICSGPRLMTSLVCLLFFNPIDSVDTLRSIIDFARLCCAHCVNALVSFFPMVWGFFAFPSVFCSTLRKHCLRLSSLRQECQKKTRSQNQRTTIA